MTAQTSREGALTLRYMQVPDISDVMEIDHASFKPPWPERSYRFELNESQVSYMVVLERQEARDQNGWQRLFNQLRGTDEQQTALAPVIVGYGGLWKIAEEAHISTIASHPNYRGRKYGEILLAGMLQRAMALRAGYVVLEVRVSNQVAQGLYKKYGFEIHSTKKGYYHHDREDAYDMRLDLNEATMAQVNRLVQALRERVPYSDHYATTPHPRLRR
ncbi:MAG: ribosomal protein S18-alanine N-acetyltransferase [Anaerolineae bacterium]